MDKKRKLSLALLAALSGCATLEPYVHVGGTTLVVSNPSGRETAVKVTCSKRVFDGEYDRWFWVKPESEVTFKVRNGVICAVEKYDRRTAREVALDVVMR